MDPAFLLTALIVADRVSAGTMAGAAAAIATR